MLTQLRGSPDAKLVVPSMGSMNHVGVVEERAGIGPSEPVLSSPMMSCVGKWDRIWEMMYSSFCVSTAVAISQELLFVDISRFTAAESSEEEEEPLVL